MELRDRVRVRGKVLAHHETLTSPPHTSRQRQQEKFMQVWGVAEVILITDTEHESERR